MRRSQLQTILLTAVIGLGASVPAFAQSRAERNREAAEAQGSNNRWSYEKLPPAVRDALDHERGDRKVISVYLADRGDRSWYSAVIETRRGDRVIRLSPRGYVLGVGDLSDEEVKVFRATPDRWYKDYVDRAGEREKFYNKDIEHVTATGDHPEIVEWERIPARIRSVILRENIGERPQNAVVRYREKDNVVYQINLKEPGREHMMKILPDGSIFEEGDFDPKGKFIVADLRPKTVLEEDLPRAVRDTVDREAPRGQISHIDVFNRNGRDVFTVEVDSRASTRYLTVSEGGKVLSDISDKY